MLRCRSDTAMRVFRMLVASSAALGVGMTAVGLYNLVQGVEIYQLDLATERHHAILLNNSLWAGLLAVATSAFTFIMPRSKRLASLSIVKSGPVMRGLSVVLLVSLVMTSVASMMLSLGAVTVLGSLAKERFNDEFGDQCDMVSSYKCSCRLLYMTGVPSCDYVFDSLPKQQNLIAYMACGIVCIASACLVIVLSVTLVPLRQRMLALFHSPSQASEVLI